ncbi:MAG: hypothetical protein Q7R66_07920 [Undibacterium sp.]|uniref:hypothetical protein n=1 Tax=Undibacterium sp. TaxID=1914977 RepID=UPI002723CAE2|nr:hypothetical protein [Undibacterium sp.]MDO8652101.1 hypothetical protein [Undibacterium sp.]
MSEINKRTVAPAEPVDVPVQASHSVESTSRRRLIKLGSAAVPVVATLVSRPALAWHCKSPSAWGSEIINPNTSLKTNAGHQSYPDEAWYITDWRDNVARSSAGFGDKPWKVLCTKYPGLKDATTTTNGSFDYTKVTISKLLAVIPGLRSTASSNSKVKAVLTSGSDLQISTLVAQLNYILLSPLSANQIESCLSGDKLQKMALGNYSPSGLNQTWDAAKIKTYLYENWIAR